jgi:hypothetical protein
MPKNDPSSNGKFDKKGYRPLNEGYSPKEERGYSPKVQSGSLPKAPLGGTGESPKPKGPVSDITPKK